MCPQLCIRMSVCLSSVKKDLARPIMWLFLTEKLLTGSGGVSIHRVATSFFLKKIRTFQYIIYHPYINPYISVHFYTYMHLFSIIYQ